MNDKLMDRFNQLNSGEQVLLLITAGVIFLAIGIQAGRFAFLLFGG